MTTAEFEAALTERAQRNLTNSSLITPEVVSLAASEAEAICEGRQVPDWAKLDIGMYRLKINIKIGLSDTDENLYKQAMKEVRNSPVINDDDTTSFGTVIVKQREESWL